jgi:hypothetical protein
MKAFLFLVMLLAVAGAASWRLFRTENQMLEYTQPRQYDGEITEALEMDLRPLHLQDNRWYEVIDLVESVEQKFAEALRQHYGREEGDFLQFRRAREDILKDLESSLVILNEMLVTCGNSKSSSLAIRQQLMRADRLATEIKLDLRH